VGLAVLPLAYAGSPVGVLAAVLSGPPSGSWFESERLTALLDVLAVWTASLTSVSAVGVPRRAAGSRPRPAVLSDRQRAIVELVGDGLTNAQVAARVGFSESTVKQEVSALCEAFGASGRRDLARLVFLAGV
jgi:DNA-binding NarL/FixJ family response regulator